MDKYSRLVPDTIKNELRDRAQSFDKTGAVCSTFIKSLFQEKLFGTLLKKKFGGGEISHWEYCSVHEEIGELCASTRCLITAHDMVCMVLEKFGTAAQKAHWLRRLTDGSALAAFALTENNAGTDVMRMSSEAKTISDGYLISGRKAWITGGQNADVFLIFCKTKPDQISAFLVDKNSAKLEIEPIAGMLGMRATMLVNITLDQLFVEKSSLIGNFGDGYPKIITYALTYGRLGVASGAVGITKGALDIARQYSKDRIIRNCKTIDYQLVKGKIADMICNLSSARLLCLNAAGLLDKKDPRAMIEVSIAKLYATRVAFQAASEAVQILGAIGCSDQFPVERYLRDAKILEIIEGANEVHQDIVATYGYSDQPVLGISL